MILLKSSTKRLKQLPERLQEDESTYLAADASINQLNLKYSLVIKP